MLTTQETSRAAAPAVISARSRSIQVEQLTCAIGA